HEPRRKVTRRGLGKAAMGIVTGVLVSGTEAPAVASQTVVSATTPVDPRIAAIEKSLAKPLSAEKRKAVIDNITGNEEAWSKARAAFTVPDQTEPDFVFTPTAFIEHPAPNAEHNTEHRTPNTEHRTPT